MFCLSATRSASSVLPFAGLLLALAATSSPRAAEPAATIAGVVTDAFEPIRLVASDLPEPTGRGDVAPERPEEISIPPAPEPDEPETEQELKADESQLTDDALIVGADVSLKPVWNNGLEVMSSNREFRVHVGGRAQIDTTAFTAGPGPQPRADRRRPESTPGWSHQLPPRSLPDRWPDVREHRVDHRV